MNRPLVPFNDPELQARRALEREQELESVRRDALYKKILEEAAASSEVSTSVDSPNPRDINSIEIFKREDTGRIKDELASNDKKLKELQRLVKTGYITDTTKIDALYKRQQKLNDELEALSPNPVFPRTLSSNRSKSKNVELLSSSSELPLDKTRGAEGTLFIILRILGVVSVINSLAAWVRQEQAVFNKLLKITAWVLLPLIAVWTVYSLLESNTDAHSDQLAAWDWDQMSTDEKREDLLGDSLEEVRAQESWYEKSCRENFVFFWC